jgi:hypothetical protein
VTNYTSIRIIDGKSRKVITDEDGKIINRNPTKEELKGVDVEQHKDGRSKPRLWQRYTDEQLLDALRGFEKEYGRLPTWIDFDNSYTFVKRFGSWNEALEKAFGIKRHKYEYERELYTDEELLNELRYFEKTYGRPPTEEDLKSKHIIPCLSSYVRHFGNWNEALKLVGMDLDTRVVQGHLETESERGRYAELIIKEMFDNRGKDVSGENRLSPFDGICPNSQTYEVKSSALLFQLYWIFGAGNKDKDDDIEAIQWYYFVAFNKYYTKILHIWRVPGEIVNKIKINVWVCGNTEFNVDNMKEYDIIDKLKKINKLKKFF